MSSYAERIDSFNNAARATSDHIKNIRDAVSNADPADPVGLAETVTGEVAGGVSTLAGGVAGIQHFRAQMNAGKSIFNRLGLMNKKLSGQGSGPGDPPASGSGAADANPAGATPAQAPVQKPFVDSSNDGVGDLGNLDNQADADAANAALDANISKLSPTGLSNVSQRLGSGTIDTSSFSTGSSRQAMAKGNLIAKQNIVNDAQNADNQAEFDAQSTPDPAAAPPSAAPDPAGATPNPSASAAPNPAARVNSGGDGSNIAPDPDTGAASDDSGISSMLQRGQAMFKSITGQTGDVSQAANAVSRVQQAGADLALRAQGAQQAGSRALLRTNNLQGDGTNPFSAPKPIGQAGGNLPGVPDPAAPPGTLPGVPDPAAPSTLPGVPDPATTPSTTLKAVTFKPSPTASAGAGAADEAGGDAAAMGLEEAAPEAGPLAPVLGLVGALVGIGTSIAAAFHKKPPPPPPPTASTLDIQSVGANLSNNPSVGAGLY